VTLAIVGAAIDARQVFRAGVDAVAVDVLVTRGGRPVPGLRANDFELRDNGIVQRIESVALQDVPITLLLALDVSESVEGKPLEHLQAAVGAAAAALGPGDRLALITFSDRVRMASAPTANLDAVRRASMQVEAGGATALYDGTFAALTLRQRVEGRAVMLVFSDGDDTVSWIDPRQVLAAAQQSDVAVYGVSLERSVSVADAGEMVRRQSERRWFHDEPSMFGRHFLPLLVEDTGGSLLVAERSVRLRETFVGVVNEFKSRYVLTYSPEQVESGGWHDIQVRLKGQRGDVRARRGYLRDTR
jgi:VWFA-related protein